MWSAPLQNFEDYSMDMAWELLRRQTGCSHERISYRAGSVECSLDLTGSSGWTPAISEADIVGPVTAIDLLNCGDLMRRPGMLMRSLLLHCFSLSWSLQAVHWTRSQQIDFYGVEVSEAKGASSVSVLVALDGVWAVSFHICEISL